MTNFTRVIVFLYSEWDIVQNAGYASISCFYLIWLYLFCVYLHCVSTLSPCVLCVSFQTLFEWETGVPDNRQQWVTKKYYLKYVENVIPLEVMLKEQFRQALTTDL